MNKRISRLRAQLAEKQLDAFLTLKTQNVFYLSGFTGDTGGVLITTDKAYFFADGRFVTQAAQEAAGFEVVPVERSFFESIAAFLSDQQLQVIGVEANDLSIGSFNKLHGLLPQTVKLKPEDQLLETLRMIKDEDELGIMRKAVRLTEAAFEQLLPLIKPGVSERYLQVQLLKLMYDAGFSGPSFDFIVASGERGALPHGVASDRIIKAGEMVTLDFGGIYRHYCSDMTRTVAVGDPNPELSKIYDLVLAAQVAAEEAARPGISGKELDQVARRVIEAGGYGQYFGHGLGHGVGLEIHELPVASPKGQDLLAPGMIVTIEPGIYIPGLGGVRIENELEITGSGASSLNGFTKELLVL